MTYTYTVTHDWQDETPESKARWFQSLSLNERMKMFCWFTDMVLSANPRIVEEKDAEPIAGRVLVLTKTQRKTFDCSNSSDLNLRLEDSKRRGGSVEDGLVTQAVSLR